jgi:hypothetical protein
LWHCYFRNSQRKISFDHYDFATGYDAVADYQIHGSTHLPVEFDHVSRAQSEHLSQEYLGRAEVERGFHLHVQHNFHIGLVTHAVTPSF